MVALQLHGGGARGRDVPGAGDVDIAAAAKSKRRFYSNSSLKADNLFCVSKSMIP